MSDMATGVEQFAIQPQITEVQIPQNELGSVREKFDTDLSKGYQFELNRESGKDIVNTAFLYNPSTSSAFTLRTTDTTNRIGDINSNFKVKNLVQTRKVGDKTISLRLTFTNQKSDNSDEKMFGVKVAYLENGVEMKLPGDQNAAVKEMLHDYTNSEFDPEIANAEFNRLQKEGKKPQWNIQK